MLRLKNVKLVKKEDEDNSNLNNFKENPSLEEVISYFRNRYKKTA